MPPQPPLTQPAYDDLHAILTHYEAEEAGLGHRIAHRLRDNLRDGKMNGMDYMAYRGHGRLFCSVAQLLEGKAPNENPGDYAGFNLSREWIKRAKWHAERFIDFNIRVGMTPENSPAADALDACIEDWLHLQEATLPASRVSVVAQGMTPRDLAALKAQVAP